MAAMNRCSRIPYQRERRREACPAARLAGEAGDDWAKLPLADQDRYYDLAKENNR